MSSLAVGSYKITTGPVQMSKAFASVVSVLLIYRVSHELRSLLREVFLMLKYTDITQNTYIQSGTVTEIMAREKCGHLAFPRTVRLQLCRALTLTEQCSTQLCACTSSAQRDKIVFHYCRYSCAMYSAW